MTMQSSLTKIWMYFIKVNLYKITVYRQSCQFQIIFAKVILKKKKNTKLQILKKLMN